jgi:hypothetical protein
MIQSRVLRHTTVKQCLILQAAQSRWLCSASALFRVAVPRSAVLSGGVREVILLICLCNAFYSLNADCLNLC